MITNLFPRLRFGDILLKDRGASLNALVKLKRGTDVSHSELFVGSECGHARHQVITAFPKGGVDFYPVIMEGLRYILRPYPLWLPTRAGLTWFEEQARGQPYDFFGQMSFVWAQVQGADNGKQFCSEVIARVFKKSNHCLLHPLKDCDTFAPDSFKDSPYIRQIWQWNGPGEQDWTA